MPPDETRLREIVETLERIERPPASAGEAEAAEWIRARFAALGLEARIEEEPATGSFPIPVALLAAAGALAGLSRGRVLPAALGLAAAAGIADDVSGGRHWFRRLLPRKVTRNVIAEAGDPRGEEVLVLVAHHDAANAGIVFDPRPSRWVADTFPEFYARQETSPPLMQLVVAGPALAGLGALLGARGLRRAGGILALGSALVVGEIAVRRVVPGANDNLAAVAVLLELARLLREEEEPLAGVRLVLLSTGAEESFMEGMRGFVARHGAALDPARTRFVVLECVGGPEAILLEGEGMLRVRDYTAQTRDWLAACAERAGHPLRRRLRSGFATDALIALKAGFPTVAIAAVDRYKMAPNYHSRDDVAANLDLSTVAAVTRICLEAARSLELSRSAPARA